MTEKIKEKFNQESNKDDDTGDLVFLSIFSTLLVGTSGFVAGMTYLSTVLNPTKPKVSEIRTPNTTPEIPAECRKYIKNIEVLDCPSAGQS